MAWIEKRGSRYLVCWREDDGRRSSKSFVTKAEAKEHKNELELQIGRRLYVGKDVRREPFGTYVMGVVTPNLKPSTRYAYEKLMQKWVVPTIGDIPVADLTQRVFRHLFLSMADAGASAATQAKVKVILSKSMNQAITEGILHRNPLRGVEVAKAPHREVRILTTEEVATVHDHMRPRYRAAVTLAAYGGLRLGEIAALRREHAYGHIVMVRQALVNAGGKITVDVPKSRSSVRNVSLPRAAWLELAEHAMAYSHDGWLFRSVHGGWLQGGTFLPIWREALEGAKLEDPQPRFHDLRHTHASWLIERGAHPKEIQERMGHGSISITMDVYGHLFPGSDEKLALLLEDAEEVRG